jgi:23S rRNA (uracil1939-C5)-methyltransferase
MHAMSDTERERMTTGDHATAREPATADDGARVSAGDVLEVLIERIVPGGAGMAHARGLTVFVPLAAPGDRLRIVVERVKGRVAFAALKEIVAGGSERVEPPCPYFGRCGGCDFQQLNYSAQLAAKVEIIRDCLRRIAHIDPPQEIPVTPSPAEWHYRSRARWQHDARERRLGYYELASHRVIDVAECPVVVPELQGALKRLRATVDVRATTNERATLDERATINDEASRVGGASRFAGAREFEAVAGDDGVSIMPPLDERDAGERVRVIAGERYRFDAACFFQINHALLDALVAAAIGDERGDVAVDLYCGVGLFTLPLARRFARVIGVEGNADAARYARRNLSDAALSNAEIKIAQVGDFLARRAARLAPVDLVLLDPPRAGAEHGAVAGIINLRPRRIVYVSCDPATLARDLRELVAHGYALDSLAAFDMFPQTHHVETVARLTRAAVSPS